MFWRENVIFPFAHYVVPLALYLASRSLWFSLFIMYLWESIETIIGEFIDDSYQEPWYDRFVGDPLHGGMSILTAWAADEAFCWRNAFETDVHVGLRFGFFVTIFIGQILLILPSKHWIGIFVYGTFYIGMIFAFFWPVADSAMTRNSLIVVVIVVAVQTIVVCIPTRDGPSYLSSRFSRSFLLSLVTIAVLGFVAGAVSDEPCLNV